jgi:hypothetical protein
MFFETSPISQMQRSVVEWFTFIPYLFDLHVLFLTVFCFTQLTAVYSKIYSRNVIDMDWRLVVKLALPAKVTRRANKVTGIYDRSH